MKRNILLFVIYCFFIISSPASAWVIDADFERGVIGEKADGDDGLTGAFKYTIYTNKVVRSGKQAAEVGIDAGSMGFGTWGGSFKYPSNLGNGDELWFRVWAYFPKDFSFYCGGCTQGVKFMRIHTAASDFSNEGYHSILLKDNIIVDSEVTGKIFHSNNGSKKSAGQNITTGAWHAYEMYIKFASTPGQGIYRVWQDGNLVFEDTITQTLKSSSSISDLIYLFSYWNNGAPKTQQAYVDEIVVTSTRPSDIDSHGNHFIGLSGINVDATSNQAPPNPPLIQ